jgi:hypothetical protein
MQFAVLKISHNLDSFPRSRANRTSGSVTVRGDSVMSILKLDLDRQPNKKKDSRISGKLGSVTINDIIQLLGINKRRATLFLNRHGQHGRIYFRDGNVLHAETGSKEGEAALARLLRWQDAEFIIEEETKDPPRFTISKSTEAVMLEVLTKLDEAGHAGMVLTPVPMITRDIKELDRKIGSSVRRAPRPSSLARRHPARRRLAWLWFAVGIAVASGLIWAALISVRIAPVPPITQISKEIPARTPLGPKVSTETFLALLESETSTEETQFLLSSHGVTVPPEALASLVTQREPTTEPVRTTSTQRSDPPATLPEDVQRFGHLLIVVEPWAEVFVDGHRMGETPLSEIQLTVGTHEIALANSEFAGVIKDQISIAEASTVRRRYTFNDYGFFHAIVTPWASVYIDDRYVDQTPMTKVKVPSGSHRVTLHHPELGEESTVVEIQPNETTVLKIEM